MSQFQPQPPMPPPSAVPPSTYGYGGPPAMMSLSGLARAIQIMISLMAVVAVVNAGIRFNRAGLIDDTLDGNPSISDLLDADDRVIAGIVLYAIGLIVTGVVFIIWQFRHAKNAQNLGARQGLGPGWAIGGWFIPCANYVLPSVQLFQSSRGSSPQRRGSGIVIAWAIVYGLGNVLVSAAYFGQDTDSEGNYIVSSADDVRALADADRLGGMAFIVMAVAAVLAVVTVGQLTRRQHDAWTARYHAARGQAPPSAPAPPLPAPPPPVPSQAEPSAQPPTWSPPGDTTGYGGPTPPT